MIDSSSICCPLAACPKSGECFRHINYQKQLAEADSYSVINTTRITPDAKGCPHFIVEKTERWAYGFKALYNTIPTGNARNMSWGMYFGSDSTFFRTKRGERPLTPAAQRHILDTIARHGGNPSVGFDRYQDVKVYGKP